MPSRHGGGKPTRQERVVLPIAQRLLSMYCAQVIESVVWIFRAGDGWSFGKAAVDREVVRMDPTTTTRDRKEVYDLLLNMSPRGAFADARYVAFANGDLDVETLSLMPRSPQRVVPCPLPWGWDPSARSTRVEDYLATTANGDADTYYRIEEMLGSAVSRERFGLVYLLVGRAKRAGGTASNGKSTLAEVACHLVGDGNATTMSVSQYGQPFLTKNLHSKLVAASTDTGVGGAPIPSASVEILKKVATQDLLECDVKYQPDAIRFRPFATPIIAGNDVPRELAADDGLQRRLAPIVLTGSFPQTGASPADELDNEGDMEALLVHAVAGLRRLRQSGPTASPAAAAVAASLATAASTVQQWLADMALDESTLGGRTVSSTFDGYKRWAAGALAQPTCKADFEAEVLRLVPSLEIRKCRWNGASPQRRWMIH